ncbi:MAG TPA: helix-turn-helix transcriptional regulator [Isosphaeraceae bacterium]|nr:helix-turn-helix transcriptional regulator [Isosphaeraceae bacterium]
MNTHTLCRKFRDKLYHQIVMKGYRQKKLSEISGVSDSEISRLLRGDPDRGPFPGLVNAFRLARALEVSLDFLADDNLDHDPLKPPAPVAPEERELVELASTIGFREARRLLENAQILGYEVAIRRLLGAEMKPLIEVGDGRRAPSTAPMAAPSVPHANSA